MPKIKTKKENPFLKLDLIEDENIYFEDINELDKYMEEIDNMED